MAKTLVEILEIEDIQLKKKGERLVAHCPFHEGDNEPSFTIYPTGTYYCFGCKMWGDAVKFLVDYKGISARKALEIVGEDYVFPKEEKPQVIKVKNVVETWSFLYRVASEYHNYCRSVRGAISYLLGRGLTEETIDKYKIGYTDGNVLNLKFAHERKIAQEIGIMNGKGFELMGHRITIPNLLDNEQCDFLVGRTVVNDKIKYLGARMPKPLLGFHEVRQSPIIFIVEGQFDWLTLRQWGYPAICIGGSEMKPYVRLPLLGKQIVIIPDIDEKGIGMEIATKMLEAFEDAEILDISPLREEYGKLDVSVLAQMEDGEEKFKQLVRERLPWITLLLPSQQKKWFPLLEDRRYSLST